jgi:hypothetical protein
MTTALGLWSYHECNGNISTDSAKLFLDDNGFIIYLLEHFDFTVFHESAATAAGTQPSQAHHSQTPCNSPKRCVSSVRALIMSQLTRSVHQLDENAGRTAQFGLQKPAARMGVAQRAPVAGGVFKPLAAGQAPSRTAFRDISNVAPAPAAPAHILKKPVRQKRLGRRA